MTCSGSACGKQIRFSKGAVWTVSICFHISHAHLGSGLKYSRICHSGAFSEADPRCVLVNASLSQFQAPSDRSAIARQRCRCTKLGHCFPDIWRFRSYHLIFVPLAIRINYSDFSAVVFQLRSWTPGFFLKNKVPLTRESSNTGTVSTAWMPGFHEGSKSIQIRDLCSMKFVWIWLNRKFCMVHNAVNDSVSHKRSRQSLCDAVASTCINFISEALSCRSQKARLFRTRFGCKRVSKINRGVLLGRYPIAESKKSTNVFWPTWYCGFHMLIC